MDHMRLSQHAEKYVAANGLRSHMIASNCRRFERLTGITQPDRVSLPVLQAFRSACLATGLSNVTTEKTITDVMTIVRHAVGAIPPVGKRLRQPRPEPHPVAISDLDAIFCAAKTQRLKRWICLAYWTGLRLADSAELYDCLCGPADVIRHTASKTGLHHAFPVPGWLLAWMPENEPCRICRNAWFCKLLRDELARTCEEASVAVITPKQIRQASITEWSRANATAGAIIHGCGLGVLSCYIDPLSVLESAAPRVRVPDAMRGKCETADTETALLSHFRRLDPAAQGIISMTAERLAAG
jgi:hypothetical protein